MRSICPAVLMTMLMLAGCVPADIATGRCRNVGQGVGEPMSCTVKGDVVGRMSSISFDTESRNQIAQVSIALQVTKGTLRVTYYDLNLTGEQHLLVTPSEPANLQMQTRMRKDDRSFSLRFEPVNGKVEGLTGTVNYKTP